MPSSLAPPSCLLFVVQATASMRQPMGALPNGTPRPARIKAAMHIVSRTLRRLLDLARGDPLLRALDVGILVYRGNAAGETGLLTPLAGVDLLAPFVRLTSRLELEPVEARGEARAAEALTVVVGLLRAWLAEHPGAIGPRVVHLTDGTLTDDTLVRVSRSLGVLAAQGQNVILSHAILNDAAPFSVKWPAAARDVPGPLQDLWDLSTPYEDGQRRQMSINDLVAADGIAWVSRHGVRKEAPPCGLPPSAWRVQAHSLWLQKGSNAPAECEDAFTIDVTRGRAAVSDGAGSGIFSRLWASLLTRTLWEDELVAEDPVQLARWLEDCRARWLAEINFPTLRPPQQHRVRTMGAGATLLSLRVDSAPAEAPADHFAWSAWAVGDSCLFLVRGNRLWATFPLLDSSDFNLTPPLLRTLGRASAVTPLSARGIGQSGDLFLLATDATAQFFLRRCEEGRCEWDGVWEWDQAAWLAKVVQWRESGDMVDDDCTLVALRPIRADAAENGDADRVW
jgi:hypothetical protein